MSETREKTDTMSDDQLIVNLKSAFGSGCPYLVIYSRRQDIGIQKCQRGVELGYLRFEEYVIDDQETHWRYYWTDKAKTEWGELRDAPQPEQPSEPAATPSIAAQIKFLDAIKYQLVDQHRFDDAKAIVSAKQVLATLVATDAPTEAGIDLPTEPGLWINKTATALVYHVFANPDSGEMKCVAVSIDNGLVQGIQQPASSLPRGGWSRAVSSSEVAALREENERLTKQLLAGTPDAIAATETAEYYRQHSRNESQPWHVRFFSLENAYNHATNAYHAAREIIERLTKEHDAMRGRLLLWQDMLDKFMRDALVAIAGAVCTPEKGYMVDGGPSQLLADIKTLRKQHDQWKANHDEMVFRNALLRDRKDLTAQQVAERCGIWEKLTAAESEVARLKGEVERLTPKVIQGDGVTSIPEGHLYCAQNKDGLPRAFVTKGHTTHCNFIYLDYGIPVFTTGDAPEKDRP